MQKLISTAKATHTFRENNFLNYSTDIYTVLDNNKYSIGGFAMGACIKMVNSNAIASQIVAVGSNVLFTADKITSSYAKNCGCCVKYIQHDNGSGLYTITQPGTYRILFRCNVTAIATGTASLVIKSNGEGILESLTQDLIATAGNPLSTMTFADVVIPCGCSSKTISVGNASTIPLTITNANIEIIKL